MMEIAESATLRELLDKTKVDSVIKEDLREECKVPKRVD